VWFANVLHYAFAVLCHGIIEVLLSPSVVMVTACGSVCFFFFVHLHTVWPRVTKFVVITHQGWWGRFSFYWDAHLWAQVRLLSRCQRYTLSVCCCCCCCHGCVCLFVVYAFNALTLLVGWQDMHLACRKTECYHVGGGGDLTGALYVFRITVVIATT